VTRLFPPLLLGLACVFRAGLCAAAPAQARDFVVDGVRIRYWSQGTGTPVLLIHGAHSSASGNWMKPGIMGALARNHRVLALDLPGYGESDKPEDPRAYGSQWVEDVAALLDDAGVRRAHIVGYSMGGFVALKFIQEHPDRALSGTLGGSGWLRAGGFLERAWAHLPTLGARGVAQLSLTREELAAIKTPVELIAGGHDIMRPLYVTPLSSARPGWPLVVIPGDGHVSCVADPRLRDELARWIDANDAANRAK